MRRDYLALVHGRPAKSQDTIDAPIGRDPHHRTRMAVVRGGRRAVTHYRVVEVLAGAALLAVSLETGRTHQIRVHCASIGHPVLGDPVYGRRARAPGPGLGRQALHACRLRFAHPRTGAALEFESPLPPDLRSALDALRAGRPGEGRSHGL